MGQYYEWIDTVKKGILASDLIDYLEGLGFKYHIIVENHFVIGSTICNHPEINEMTIGEWTGFFESLEGNYIILFKDESDALAAKLRWI